MVAVDTFILYIIYSYFFKALAAGFKTEKPSVRLIGTRHF